MVTLAAIRRGQEHIELLAQLQQLRSIDRHGRRRGDARPHRRCCCIREDAIELLLDVHDAPRRAMSSPMQDGQPQRQDEAPAVNEEPNYVHGAIHLEARFLRDAGKFGQAQKQRYYPCHIRVWPFAIDRSASLA
jgi:hypothetical protein